MDGLDEARDGRAPKDGTGIVYVLAFLPLFVLTVKMQLLK